MRLVCMLMVVSLHYFGESGNAFENAPAINSVIAGGMVVVCRGAVNCFYLNSGYFLSDNVSLESSWNNTLRLYKQIWLYSVIVFIISAVLGIGKWSTVATIRAFFPILGNQWWFITVFILLSILRPIFGKIASEMDNNRLLFLIAVLLYFDSVQAVFGVNVFNEMGNGLLHGIAMLFLGYAIRRFDKLKLSQRNSICVYVVCVVTTIGMRLILKYCSFIPIDYWKQIMVYNSPVMIALAWGLFSFFRGLKIKNSFISKISSSTLAIYLIQDHSMMREALWIKVFKSNLFYTSRWMLIHFVVSVSILAFVGIGFDCLLKIVRKKLLKEISR